MSGEFGSPYRAPCGGWPAAQQWFLGGSFQDTVAGKQAVARWLNITKVPDWNKPPASGGIVPYPRVSFGTDWPAETSGGCDLQPSPGRINCTDGTRRYGAAGTCPTPAGTAPLWGPWEDSMFPACATADATHATVDRNCFVADGSTADLSHCLKVGFKNVQAFKVWQGIHGYLSHDANGRPSRKKADAASGGNCATNVEDEQTAHDGMRYLSETLTCVYNGAQTSTVTATMGRTTGVVTASGSEQYDDAGNSPSYELLLQFTGFTAANAIGLYEQWFNQTLTWTETTADGINWTATGVDEDGNTVTVTTLNVESGAYSETGYGYDYNGVWTTVHTETLTVSNTDFDFEVWAIAPSPNLPATTYSMKGTLSGSYAEADLWSDVAGLLGQWDLANDVVYPWRWDELLTVAPLVAYNEAWNNNDLSFRGAVGWQYTQPDGSSTPYTDSAAGTYDGSVLGAPLPAGYGPHFDRTHLTWRCCMDLAGNPVFYKYAYGAWSGGRTPAGADGGTGDDSDLAVPKSATRWTDNYTAEFLPPGPFWMYLNLGVGALGPCAVAQKWAECRVPCRSQNFARPCGRDRLAMDETTVRCGTMTGGTSAAPQVTLDSASALAAGDQVLAWGIANVTTGLWTVTAVAGLVVTLGSNVAIEASLLDSWRNVGTGLIGRLRWPAAPGFGGRLAVAAATNAAPIVVHLPGARSLRTGDSIVISGATGNTAANGTWTVTQVSAEVFSLNGSSGNGAYTGGGYAQCAGLAHYEFNDDQWKGDFLFFSWAMNLRDYQERERYRAQWNNYPNCHYTAPAPGAAIRTNQVTHGMPQAVSAQAITAGCVAWSVTAPRVIACTPNGETWTGGVVYRPGAFSADSRYGSQWQGYVVQHVPDPLWQAPHAPCGTTCAYLEDPGGCVADACEGGAGNLYYPQRPWVEARQTVPTINGNVPVLPAGVYVGFLGLSDLDTTGTVNGNVLAPPGAVGDAGCIEAQPNAIATSWGRWLAEVQCVLAGERWAAAYDAQGVAP